MVHAYLERNFLFRNFSTICTNCGAICANGKQNRFPSVNDKEPVSRGVNTTISKNISNINAILDGHGSRFKAGVWKI